ncbi:MAG: transketolase C-terminal domain-containing protein [Dehalococcoidia bacterium]|nr:transketolase C-terminal domain-containing protein [Dehalococcoidia bacterium]MDD5493893.1 transketolase C-terminal domain-containing protein [Dehalococcoidia bacterium]
MATQKKSNIHILDGNQAAAIAAKLSRVQVIAAYPITPQTPLTEQLSQYVEAGELQAEYVAVESEHSAMAVCTSASLVGARAFTATSSHGLAYMHEMLHWAAGARLPIVLACVNRAIGAPWNVLNDQQDSIAQRDTGWIQIYCRNNQEIMDSVIQAFRIAEIVHVPVMVCYDGYILSHTEMPVDIPDQAAVDRYLPAYQPHTVLDPSNPKNYNLVTLANPRVGVDGKLCHGYMELRYLLQEALQNSRETILQAGREFNEVFGRDYSDMFWEDREDAEITIVAMGSLAMEAIVAADMLREEGIRVGVLGLRVFRPFPKSDVVRALRKSKLIVVFDKNISYGSEGATCSEIKSALYGTYINASIRNFIVGLGGRDIKARELVDATKKAIASLKETVINPDYPEWICQI